MAAQQSVIEEVGTPNSRDNAATQSRLLPGFPAILVRYETILPLDHKGFSPAWDAKEEVEVLTSVDVKLRE